VVGGGVGGFAGVGVGDFFFRDANDTTCFRGEEVDTVKYPVKMGHSDEASETQCITGTLAALSALYVPVLLGVQSGNTS
jgi:hypothetical protein